MFSGTFCQAVEVLLPSNCQFGSNKLIKILADLDVSYVDPSVLIKKDNMCKTRKGSFLSLAFSCCLQ